MEGQMSLFNTPEVSGTSALKVSRDFGEHIGGARKELWSAGGINLEDLLDMNDAEKAKFVKKDNIWKKPDYEQMVEAGVPKVVAYAIKEVRNAIPAKPYVSYFEQDDPEKVKYRMECYVKFVTMIRDTMSGVSSEEEFMEKQQVVYNQIVDPERSARYRISTKPEYTGLFQTKLLRAIRCGHQTFSTNYAYCAEKEQFAVKKEDKIPAGWKIEKYSPDGFYSRSRVGCIKDTLDYRTNFYNELQEYVAKTYLVPLVTKEAKRIDIDFEADFAERCQKRWDEIDKERAEKKQISIRAALISDVFPGWDTLLSKKENRIIVAKSQNYDNHGLLDNSDKTAVLLPEGSGNDWRWIAYANMEDLPEILEKYPQLVSAITVEASYQSGERAVMDGYTKICQKPDGKALYVENSNGKVSWAEETGYC